MRLALIALTTLLATSTLSADDSFNCPKPEGEIAIDPDVWNAWPTHTDKWLPMPLDVDFVCSINADGRFSNCKFAARAQLTESQFARVKEIMARMMNYVKSDTPNQPCVASTIRLEMPSPESS